MNWERWWEAIAAWLMAALIFAAMLAFQWLDGPHHENGLLAPPTSNSGTTLRPQPGTGASSDSCSDIDYVHERC